MLVLISQNIISQKIEQRENDGTKNKYHGQDNNNIDSSLQS